MRSFVKRGCICVVVLLVCATLAALTWVCTTHRVYRIRGNAMMPTLVGDPDPADMALVSKLAYLGRVPERWDIIVFRYPQDPARAYIKRIVGLPGESVQIRDGDVYVGGRIARKPWPAQEALWRRQACSGNAACWLPDDPRCWRLADDEFVAECGGAEEPTYLTYTRAILAYEEDTFRRSRAPSLRILTSDAMVQFRLSPREATGAVHVGLTVRSSAGPVQVLDEWIVRLPLGQAPACPEAFRSGELAARGSPWEQGGRDATLVQVCHVDSTLIVRLGGREVMRHEYQPRQDAQRWPGFGREVAVRIGCVGGAVAFQSPAICVDIYYTCFPERCGVHEPFRLDEGQYFVLGDNSVNSNDSRAWGAVPRKFLIGKATHIVWPPTRWRRVR